MYIFVCTSLQWLPRITVFDDGNVLASLLGPWPWRGGVQGEIVIDMSHKGAHAERAREKSIFLDATTFLEGMGPEV